MNLHLKSPVNNWLQHLKRKIIKKNKEHLKLW